MLGTDHSCPRNTDIRYVTVVDSGARSGEQWWRSGWCAVQRTCHRPHQHHSHPKPLGNIRSMGPKARYPPLIRVNFHMRNRLFATSFTLRTQPSSKRLLPTSCSQHAQPDHGLVSSLATNPRPALILPHPNHCRQYRRYSGHRMRRHFLRAVAIPPWPGL